MGLFGTNAETVENLAELLKATEGRLAETERELGAARAECERQKQRADKAEAVAARHKSAADKAKAQAKAVTAEKPDKPRPIGPVKDEGAPLGPYELQQLIFAADRVELAFSDGKREVAGLAPVAIEGEAWAAQANGLALRVPELMVEGPAPKRPPYKVAGYGLLLDGELVAYRQRYDVLEIPAGARMNLAADVLF